MVNVYTRAMLVAGALAALFAAGSAAAIEPEKSTHTLPILFFHGRTASAEYGAAMQKNLSTDARPFISLNFCEKTCSLQDLNVQIDLALAQVRTITSTDKRFANGYTFIGHSQGSALARAVIENMDDHKVHTFISLAGAGNGLFYGPQENDFVPAQTFLRVFAPLGDPKIYDYSNYTDADIRSGKLQVDMIKFATANPQYQSQLTRSPVKSDWLKYNTFFPVVNNLRKETDKALIAEQQRRKSNFLRLEAAHFFGSPHDETISPWQSSLLGQYNDVASLEELKANYSKLKVLPVTETEEYTRDTYGLQTLDKRGGLFLHTAELVAHSCWVKDVTAPRSGKCAFQPVFEKYVYPLLAPVAPSKPHC